MNSSNLASSSDSGILRFATEPLKIVPSLSCVQTYVHQYKQRQMRCSPANIGSS